MNKVSKTALALAVMTAVTGVTAQSVSAFGGKGIGMKGDRFTLVPPEMKQEFREEFQNMTEEEKAELQERRQAMREKRRAAMEKFTGLSHEEMRKARQNGENMGDILEDQGITQEDAETFLTERANEKVDHIVEKHDLTSEEEQSIRDRIVDFVQNIINRWFGE